VSFQQKQLKQTKRVCLRLKELRKNKNVTLDMLAKKTKLSKKYLKALEECRFDDLPQALIYQKNFLKSYVTALGLDPEPFLKQYTEEEITKKEINSHPRKEIKQYPFSNLPLLIKSIGIALIVISVTFYLGLQVKNILEPPPLTIYSPKDGFITSEHAVTVQGKTKKENTITINGQHIVNNENGEFKEDISLNPGLNNIIITAQKKHGKTTKDTRHVIFKQALLEENI
jgi:transcriptional regulator with XRE-family HTH domain